MYRHRGLGWTEGPVWYNDTFYFSDTMRDFIGFGVDGVAATNSGGGPSFQGQLEPGSNGLFFLDDELLVCQHGARRVVRMKASNLRGERLQHDSVVSESSSLNSPNDIIVRDGIVYFSDPIYGFLSEEFPSDRPELDEQHPVKGVYRVEYPGGSPELIFTARRPNGLAFDPEGTLWIANSEVGNMSVFSSTGRLLSIDECYGEGAVDGIKIDERGWLWTTVPGGIAVIDLASEKVLARLKVGRTSNLAFGGGYLWITGLGHVWRIRLGGQYATAFFIDTYSRSDKQFSLARLAAKTAILVGILASLRHFLSPEWRRQRMCFWMSAIFVGRVLLQMFWFWDRAISLVEIFAEAGFIIPLSLYSLAKGAKSERFFTTNTLDILGLLLFVIGTAINVGSELDRHLRRTPGKLYTQGPFAIVRHPNYTGEILSFVGFALSSGNLLNLWIPLLMAVGMVVFSAPELDLYLANRYPLDWVDYAPHVTDSFLPLSIFYA